MGPLDWSSLPCGASISRRFRWPQSGKLRPIDDYSQSQVNSAVIIHEKHTVDNPDAVCDSDVIHVSHTKPRQNLGAMCEVVGFDISVSSVVHIC